uniref:Uncharacterized protein n=1 Tax=Anguilla anguilla TaxID=7936 RepID=A0A0E9UC27_ANGAN
MCFFLLLGSHVFVCACCSGTVGFRFGLV